MKTFLDWNISQLSMLRVAPRTDSAFHHALHFNFKLRHWWPQWAPYTAEALHYLSRSVPDSWPHGQQLVIQSINTRQLLGHTRYMSPWIVHQVNKQSGLHLEIILSFCLTLSLIGPRAVTHLEQSSPYSCILRMAQTAVRKSGRLLNTTLHDGLLNAMCHCTLLNTTAHHGGLLNTMHHSGLLNTVCHGGLLNIVCHGGLLDTMHHSGLLNTMHHSGLLNTVCHGGWLNTMCHGFADGALPPQTVGGAELSACIFLL